MSVKRCLIVGAGGFGREALAWALAMAQTDWRIEGFLDSNPHALDGKDMTFPIVGDPETWQPATNEVFVCGIGDAKARLRVCGDLSRRGARFVTIIHPSAVIGINSEIGEGSILTPKAVITSNVTLGRWVLVNLCAIVGHDAVLGDGVTLSPHVSIMGYARIGRGCFLGSHACVLPSVALGDFAVAGAGSVVARNVDPNVTVVGVPAKPLHKGLPSVSAG